MILPQKNINSLKTAKNGLKTKTALFVLFTCCQILFIVSCAVQQTPTGGPQDIAPPELDSVTPPNETLNFDAEEIEMIFNEYVQLENAFQEISISPEPDLRPEFTAKRNSIVVTFADTLEENTTYQINFGKSIGDMNEGNPFPNYKYVFSTGDQIDSLRIQGSVDTYSMGPPDEKTEGYLSNVLVLIHKDQDTISAPDSLIMTKKPGYYTYADSSGNFEITNLKEGTYRLYALLEDNDSRIYDDEEELIAFLQDPLVLGADTLLQTIYLATMEGKDLEILNDRNQDARLTLLLNKKTDSLQLEVISPEQFRGKLLTEEDMATDSVVIWLPDFSYDSVKLAVGENNRYIDTIIFRNFNKKEELDPYGITDNIQQDMLPPGQHPELTFSRPVDLPAQPRIELLEDSARVDPGAISLRRLDLRRYALEYNWKPKSGYQITIGAGFINDIYGAGNNTYQRQFTADSLENYGNITISYVLSDSLPSLSKEYLVQLITVDNTIIKTDTIDSSVEITYPTLRPEEYLIRVIYDRNGNGRWDGTQLFEKIQPEKILILDPGESLRANWDQEYTVDIPPELDPETADSIRAAQASSMDTADSLEITNPETDSIGTGEPISPQENGQTPIPESAPEGQSGSGSQPDSVLRQQPALPPQEESDPE